MVRVSEAPARTEQRRRSGSEPATATASPTARESGAGRPPGAVYWLCGLALGLGLAYGVLVPSIRGADEYAHVDLVRHVADDWSYPDFDERMVSTQVLLARDHAPGYRERTPAVSADEARPRGERPSFEAAGPDVPSEVINQLPQHPPAYYLAGAGVLAGAEAALPGDPWSFDREVGLLREFSALLLAPVPLLVWHAARGFGLDEPGRLAAAAAPVAVPMLAHLGGVVTNDNLLVLASAAVTVGIARVLGGDLSRRTALVTGVVLGLAALTKGFALVLVPTLALAYVVAGAARRSWRPALGRAGIALGVTAVLGAWWWVGNLLAHARIQPGAFERDRVPVDVDHLEFATAWSGRLLRSWWGTFGWNEAHVPLGVAIAGAVAVAGLCAVALWRPGGPATEPGTDQRLARARVAVLLVPSVLLTGSVLSSGWHAYTKTGIPYASYGRYTFAGLAALAVVVAAGASRLAGRRAPLLPLAVLGVAVVMQVLGVRAVLQRYWAGPGLGDRLDAMATYAPWSTAVVAVIGAAVIVAFVGAGLAMRPSRVPWEHAAVGGRP